MVTGSCRDDPAAVPHGGRHGADDHDRVEHVHQEEAAERQVHLLGQRQVLAGLGEGDHLGVGRRGAGDLVARQRVAVHRVHTAVPADHLGQRDRHVTTTRADVDTAPAGTEAESLEGGGQWSAVHVVA